MTVLRSFLREARGATAVEFAIVSAIMIVAILFVMTIGSVFYLSEALDLGTSRAARQVMIGAAQKAGTSQSAFPTTYICPYLPAVLTCSNVIVNLQTVTEASQPGGYYSYVNSNQTALTIPPLSNASATYSPGTQGSYEYLQVIYPITFLPAVVTSYLSHGVTYNGSPAILLVSTAAFLNEQY